MPERYFAADFDRIRVSALAVEPQSSISPESKTADTSGRWERLLPNIIVIKNRKTPGNRNNIASVAIILKEELNERGPNGSGNCGPLSVFIITTVALHVGDRNPSEGVYRYQT